MPSKYAQIVDRLVKKTEKGELDWKETANKEAFQVAFPNYSLLFSQESARGSSAPDYVVSIINAEGVVVDRFSDVTLEQTDPRAELF